MSVRFICEWGNDYVVHYCAPRDSCVNNNNLWNECISDYSKAEIDLRGGPMGRCSGCQSMGVLKHPWDAMNQVQWSKVFLGAAVNVVKAGSKDSRRPSRMCVWLPTVQLCGVENEIWDTSRITLDNGGVADPFYQLSCFITPCMLSSLPKWKEELMSGNKNFSPFVLKVKKRRNC